MLLKAPAVIGHRGAAGHAPENTLAGFRAAAGLGVGWVEFDARLSADGVAMVFHDDRLERTTDGRGRFRASDAAALCRLDAGSWYGPAFRGEAVPTLAAALETIAGLGLHPNIEIKCRRKDAIATARAVERTVNAHWLAGLAPPLVSSFDHRALRALHIAEHRLPLALNVGAPYRQAWKRLATRLGCVSVHFGVEDALPGRIAAAHRAGLMVGVFTVNDAATARRLRARGADWLFSDVPDVVMAASNLAAA